MRAQQDEQQQVMRSFQSDPSVRLSVRQSTRHWCSSVPPIPVPSPQIMVNTRHHQQQQQHLQPERNNCAAFVFRLLSVQLCTQGGGAGGRESQRFSVSSLSEAFFFFCCPPLLFPHRLPPSLSLPFCQCISFVFRVALQSKPELMTLSVLFLSPFLCFLVICLLCIGQEVKRSRQED